MNSSIEPEVPVDERSEFLAVITKLESEVEQMRGNTAALRQSLCAKLDLLAYQAKDASFRLSTNQYSDGRSRIEICLAETQAAETILVSQLSEIASREKVLRTLKNMHAIDSLWKVAK